MDITIDSVHVGHELALGFDNLDGLCYVLLVLLEELLF